jgi:single-stranded-DNA-specific exonuclease
LPLRTYRWKHLTSEFSDPEKWEKLQIATKALADELQLPLVLASILAYRGMHTPEEVRVFFRPTLDDLHDPYLMDGMGTAVQRLVSAVRQKELITIYGDYDVDGTNGTALLLSFLRRVGASVQFYIPERLKEGYGISRTGIDRARENGTTLLLAVDCGITALDQVRYARSIGMDVIICDHHEPGAELPDAVAVLDPLKPNCRYPFKYLSGCGVAFKLIHALSLHEYVQTILGGSSLEELAEYLDFVALATTADIVPLAGENRTLVKLGLELINTRPRPGIQALIETSGLMVGKINSGNVVFVLAPRINAVGRLGDARRAVNLLVCESLNEGLDLARVFEEENRTRRKLDEDTFLEAQQVVERIFNVDTDDAIVLHSDNWHPGVIGIVASRLVERYYRPTIMMTTVDGVAKGSARSVAGFDIYQALKRCEDKLLQFGGHRYAAGLSVDLSRIDEFKAAFSAVAKELLTEELRTPEIRIDAEIDLKDITPKFISVLNEFAPYGPDNPRPLFALRGAQLHGFPRIVGNNHLKLKVKSNGKIFDAIGFNMGDFLPLLPRDGGTVDLAFSIEENEYAGEVIPQLKLKDLKVAGG